MQTRMLGKLEVSAVGLGGNNFGSRIDAAGTARVVHAALDAGVTLFDTADAYGDGQSERYLGEALAGRRDGALIATKFGMQLGDDPDKQGAHPDYLRQACHDSLQRLGVDHIDLYQLHVPDDSVPIDETLGALSELVDAGKVREIGCSNFAAGQIDWAQRVAEERGLSRFVSVQNHWSLLHREPETAGVTDTCAQHGLGILPFFPLASGMLTGKYRRGEPLPEGARLATMSPERAGRHVNDRNFDVVERLDAFARDRDRTILELAISWLVAQDAVASVIAGATKPAQVTANVAASGWKLSDDELAEIDRVAAPREG